MDHVRDTILDRVRAEAPPPKLVVLDLSAAPHVDMHSAHMLAEPGRTNSPRPASGCRPWRRAPRCASGCAAKGVDAKLGGDQPVHLRGRRGGQFPLLSSDCLSTSLKTDNLTNSMKSDRSTTQLSRRSSTTRDSNNKPMNIQLRHLSIATCALLLGGCASSSIKQSWKAPGYQGGPPKAIAIVAVADRGNVRRGL